MISLARQRLQVQVNFVLRVNEWNTVPSRIAAYCTRGPHSNRPVERAANDPLRWFRHQPLKKTYVRSG